MAFPQAPDSMPSTQNLVGHAGLFKLQGLTLETGANIHSSENRAKESSVTQGYFTRNLVFQSNLKSPQTHQCNYA